MDVEDPFKLEKIFDTISYAKGSSVLWMISDHVSSKNFEIAVNRYLDKFKWGCTETRDLWY